MLRKTREALDARREQHIQIIQIMPQNRLGDELGELPDAGTCCGC